MQFAEPQSNVLQMGLREGQKVAELGVGSGHYALVAAHIVGPSGRVYAIDVQEELVAHVRDAAAKRHLRNVEGIWGNIEKPGGTKLRPQAVDAVILSNTLFQLEHPDAAVAEIRRILKPGGKLLVIDWAGSYAGMGPTPEQVVPEHAAEALFITAGFHKVKDFRAGAHHYAIVFTAP